MAENNMKEVNRQLFQRMEKILPSDHSTYADLKLGDSAIRHIKTGEKEEFVLKKIKVEYSIKLNETSSCFLVKFQDRFFFVVSGNENQYDYNDLQNGVFVLNQDEEYITHHNSGLCTFLWAQEEYPYASDDIGLELIESVFCREGIVKGEFDLKELKPYFKEHYIWEVDKNIFYRTNHSILYSWFSALTIKGSTIKFPLNFSSKTQNNFIDLVENCPMDLLGSIIYRSLFSISWNYSFLELYRCLEFLYPMPYLQEYAGKLGNSNLFNEMYVHTEGILDWRPKEINALERLIREYGDSNTEILDFKKCFEQIEGNEFEDDVNTATAVAKRIYKIRNSIAHFRVNLSYQIKDKEHFDELIGCMLALILILYQKYEIEIDNIKEHAK